MSKSIHVSAVSGNIPAGTVISNVSVTGIKIDINPDGTSTTQRNVVTTQQPQQRNVVTTQQPQQQRFVSSGSNSASVIGINVGGQHFNSFEDYYASKGEECPFKDIYTNMNISCRIIGEGARVSRWTGGNPENGKPLWKVNTSHGQFTVYSNDSYVVTNYIGPPHGDVLEAKCSDIEYFKEHLKKCGVTVNSVNSVESA